MAPHESLAGQRRTAVRKPWAALGAASVTLLMALPARAEDPAPAPYRADLGLSLGWIHRAAKTDTAKNPTGATYETAFGQTVQARAALAPWLRIGVYYQRGYHTLNIPQGGLAPPGADVDIGQVLGFSLGGRLEPTLVLTPRLRLWLILGVGWGRMTASRMTVTTPTGSYTVGERAGVMVETPWGVGGSYQLIPGWLAITTDTTYAPYSAQSGSLFENTQYVDSNGVLRHTVPMPEPRSAFTQMFGLTLIR